MRFKVGDVVRISSKYIRLGKDELPKGKDAVIFQIVPDHPAYTISVEWNQ